ncbi:hypothetical protein D4764_06G0004900 [Takifugu flavidus]|uniref:Ig-like domain-containing protein n=1 Tax=Takifugu flavidus TaxID=433684 RepID=A0A5C6MZT5_9TELE|nr:hypothetical protein D4764_06G0004900 [Takifugu flavidus]
MHKDPLQLIPNTSQDNFLCAVSGVKELQSDEVYIKVKISPSTEVTEGDGVKLTCSTSCPLTNNKNYIWYLNDQLLQLPEQQNKHLVLDAVTTQHAGNYSCAVNTQRDVRSPEQTLRVQSSSLKWTLTAAAGVGVALLVFTSLVIIWIIKTLRATMKTWQQQKQSKMIINTADFTSPDNTLMISMPLFLHCLLTLTTADTGNNIKRHPNMQ